MKYISKKLCKPQKDRSQKFNFWDHITFSSNGIYLFVSIECLTNPYQTYTTIIIASNSLR